MLKLLLQGSAQDNLSGGCTLAKVLSNCIAFQHFLHFVSGGKTSLIGGKNG